MPVDGARARRWQFRRTRATDGMKRYFFGHGPRAIAAFVCYIVNGTKQRAKNLLDRELERSRLSRRDRDLATELVFGCLRRRGTLDQVLGAFSRRPVRRIQARLLEVLRVGAYQLLFLDKVPPAAAVNEAARCAGRVSSKAGVGFVNACLRALARAIRGKDDKPPEDPRTAIPLGDGLWCHLDRPVLPDPTSDQAGFLAAAHSHPRWLVERWLARFGHEETTRLLEHDNRAPAVVLRVNRLRARRHELLDHLAREGHWGKPLGEGHVALDHRGSVAGLAPLRQGLCTVQGVAASEAARLLGPRPGEMILDLCAAPGSKTAQLAELSGDQATVVAVDNSLDRLRLVAQNAQRLGLRSIRPIAANASRCGEVLATRFDAVLLDAPCSNTGVLARRAECRWRLSPETIERLAEVQKQLLAAAARALKPGGRLVYSTCSLEPEENERVVESVCSRRRELRVVESRYLLPTQTNDDGGYVALVRHEG